MTPKSARSAKLLMLTQIKTSWLIPVCLLILGFIPISAGIFRVIQLGFGATITEENARFFAAPLPVVLHIVSSSLFCTLGATQFSAAFRREHLNLHRLFGHLLIPLGLAVSISGLWMTLYYPRTTVNFDGPVLYVVRLLVGLGMSLFLVFGLIAARRQKFANHRAWMTRAFALGLGAGTQVFTHIQLFDFPSLWGETSRALCMIAGWSINIAVAEWILMRNRRRSAFFQQLS